MPDSPQIISNKHYSDPTVFAPENLIRDARIQKSLAQRNVPRICILDPDGDMVRWLEKTKSLKPDPDWACYHTDLFVFEYEGNQFGIIGCAVGASFAVLIAEQLFACGCELLISVTSSGQIVPIRKPPYFVLIEKALRDEGTSYHYLAPSEFSHLSLELQGLFGNAYTDSLVPIHKGATWTTDAPYRETEKAIEHSRDLGILAVEMEAAALYAFAEARNKAVVCFAHVTNQMAREEGDFEKGEDEGSRDALRVISTAAKAWLGSK